MDDRPAVRSLRGVPEECHGCQKPLGTHRIVTTDGQGTPLRFGCDCTCYTQWASANVSGFVRRAS